MPKILFLSIALLVFGLHRTCAKDQCEIPIVIMVPQHVDSFATACREKLIARMSQMVTLEGMEGNAPNAYFNMVADLQPGMKEVMSGLRPVVTTTAELHLHVANSTTGEKFAATLVTLKGAGQNEQQAFNAAISSLNGTNPQLQTFMKEAREKILNYYDTHAKSMIAQAENMAMQRNYGKALGLLAAIPPCCKNYDDVADAIINVYQEVIDLAGQQKLSKAQAIWNAAQNEKAAAEAGAILATIDPCSKSWKPAQKLAEEMKARIGEQWEFYKEMQREAAQLERDRIEAIRDIGKAYAKNQKEQTVINNETVVKEETPIAKDEETPIAKEEETPIAKEEETPIAKDEETPIAEEEEKN